MTHVCAHSPLHLPKKVTEKLSANHIGSSDEPPINILPPNWWLIRATYVVDGRFFGHFFGRWWGAVCTHVSHVQVQYMVIKMHGNMQGGGGLNQTLENSEI